jgi:hypothetical protein
MQPDYYNRERLMILSLIHEEYTPAYDWEMEDEKPLKLYTKVEYAINILRKLNNSGQVERVKELSKLFLQRFGEYGIGETKLFRLIKYPTDKGAYESLHQLFKFHADNWNKSEKDVQIFRYLVAPPQSL